MAASLSSVSCPLRCSPRRSIRPGILVCQASNDAPRIPTSPQETADQAIVAAQAAFNDGLTKQRIELPPPLTGATDLDDWPGGIRQMFTAILPMVERFLKGVKSSDVLQCQLQSQVLDEGDAVAFWSGEHLKALLFPTPDSLLRAKSMEPQNEKLFLLINPQWQDGQVISDFGFGQRKQDIESFLQDFQYSYFLKQYRIQGLAIRVLRCYPGDWRILVSDTNGGGTCLSEEKEKPTYKRIEEVIKESGQLSGSVFDRLKKEFDFNIQSLKEP